MIKIVIPRDERPKDQGRRRILLQIGKYKFHLENHEAHFIIRELKEILIKLERRTKPDEMLTM